MPNKEIVSLDEIGREILSRWVSLRDPNILYSLTEVNWAYSPNSGEVLAIEDEKVVRRYEVIPTTEISYETFNAWWSRKPLLIIFHETKSGNLVAKRIESAIRDQT